MFKNIDKSEEIYLFDVYKGAYIFMFPTKLDALKFLASNQEKLSWGNEICNTYLDHINMGSDKENQSIPKTFTDNAGDLRFYMDIKMVDRQYIFVDGLNRIIDFREYKKEINYLWKNNLVKYDCYPKRKSKSKWNRFYHSIPYEFRRDPVPYKGKKKGSKYYRMPKLHNLYKQIADEEYQEFVRPKRNLNNLPNVYWDDAPIRSRYKSRSWKDCTKKRKQWM